MIYAIPSEQYDRLKGELVTIQEEISSEDETAINKRIRLGQLVCARDAHAEDRYPEGERDRCYCCGDEVTPYKLGTVYFFRHFNNNNCIGKHPANPPGVHQS